MQFRSEMFGDQGRSFYNTGGLIHSIDDLQNFFDRLPADATPKVVILGVDFWWVNANQRREVFDAFDVGVDEDGTYRWEGHATAVGEFIRHPLSVRDLVTHSFGRLHMADAVGTARNWLISGFASMGANALKSKCRRPTPSGPREQRA